MLLLFGFITFLMAIEVGYLFKKFLDIRVSPLYNAHLRDFYFITRGRMHLTKTAGCMS